MTILVLVVALVFAVGVTPLIRQLALRLNFVAIPRKDRAHQQPTPLMGGVALYIGLAGAMVLLSIASMVEPERDASISLGELYIILLVGTVIALIGLWDDWRSLPPKIKAFLQLIPIIVLPATTSIKIQMQLPELLNFVLTILWFMYIVNAFNYMDNMDGTAAMVATVTAMFFTVISAINGQFVLAALAAAIAGTSFGFLRYNLFTSTQMIFMGDSGSLFLGFLLAVIGIELQFPAESPWITWPVPVLVLGVIIFDTGLVFISRTRRGQSFFQGGTDHLSHRLSRLGLDRYGVPFALGLVNAALGCVALLVMQSTLINSLAAQVLVGSIGLYLLYKLEFAASYEFITGKSPQ